MKTLIFNGSPRKNGNSSFCCDLILKKIDGEKTVINAYEENIAACTDCRLCISKKQCSIDDNMKNIIDHIIDCRKIIIVSPLYFSTLTGKLLSLFSRTQILFNREIKLTEKKGILILIGGGTSKNIEPAYLTGRVILKQMGCTEIEYLSYTNSDKIPVSQCTEFISQLKKITSEN